MTHPLSPSPEWLISGGMWHGAVGSQSEEWQLMICYW